MSRGRLDWDDLLLVWLWLQARRDFGDFPASGDNFKTVSGP